MKPTVPFITLVSIRSGRLSVAQTNQPVEDWKAAASDVPGQDYPQVRAGPAEKDLTPFIES